MYELAAEYLLPALGVVGTGVGILLGWLLWSRIGEGRVKRTLLRLEAAVGAAIGSAAEAWSAAIKKGLEDGELTGAEKQAAKNAAVKVVRDYLGTKGIRTLLKIFGLNETTLDNWIGEKVVAEAVHRKILPATAVAASAADVDPGAA